MENIKVKYTCFAVPPEGIQLNKNYSVNKDSKGYFLTDGNFTEYDDVEYIKMLFSPVDDTWDTLLATKTK